MTPDGTPVIGPTKIAGLFLNTGHGTLGLDDELRVGARDRGSRQRPQAGDRRDRPGNSAVCVIFLPPYSPDFNPIEMAFSKLKALLRKAAARSIDQLWSVVADCLQKFKPVECQHYFEAAGYDPD